MQVYPTSLLQLHVVFSLLQEQVAAECEEQFVEQEIVPEWLGQLVPQFAELVWELQFTLHLEEHVEEWLGQLVEQGSVTVPFVAQTTPQFALCPQDIEPTDFLLELQLYIVG